MTEEFINEHEAAALLGKAVQTIRNWRSKKAGPRYLKIGAAVRYRRSDVLEFVEACVVDPAAGRAA